MTHFAKSIIKSFIRVIGFITLPFDIRVGCALLLIAEVVGVYEEL